ncbi:hypothetical protein OM076_36010 [Solirubrobacter ginsenosidimutans]|jgi:hypothetical protein|uniref:Uncharacterized protein n=1 Tax=Solirubrobacter ginsenosidimutans TaxID=490573 RepID=A0A9X3MZH9_9ACTN|nr:hypothetical protein [Solirubrobacter ginsenosidimutans]MDA0165729.1 hypothetical protein [Solirubrobacter ginsenosidimutans]
MPTSVTTALQEAPLPELVQKLGVAISQAQLAMDKNSVAIAQLLADSEQGIDFGQGARSLLELGFTPTFFQITEAVIEARVAFSSSETTEWGVAASIGVAVYFVAASVNAHYSSRYSFDASGSSSIRATFVAVPPPSIFNEVLRSTLPQRT